MRHFLFKSLTLLLLPLLTSGCTPQKAHNFKNEEPLALVVKKAPPRLAPAPQSKSLNTKKVAQPAKAKKKVASKASSKAAVQPNSKKQTLIVLDAGHGGKDFGTHSKKNHYEEKKLTLMTTQMVQNYLKQMGYEVALTRSHDTFIALEKRAEIANKLEADLFVSIHYNHAPSVEAEGIEVYCYRDEKNPTSTRLVESKKLADKVLNLVVKHTNATSRGVRKANFAVIRETKMPAILIEGGFLSNPQERKKILELPYRRYLAFGIASGIDRYLGGKSVLGAN